MKIRKALVHLNELLPLKEKQMRLDQQSRDIHRSILRSFVERGYILNKKEISDMFGGIDATLILTRLSEDDLIVLDKTAKEPIGAYPMTMEKTDHLVKVNGHQIYAMCALDALGISPMLGTALKLFPVVMPAEKKLKLNKKKWNFLKLNLPGISASALSGKNPLDAVRIVYVPKCFF